MVSRIEKSENFIRRLNLNLLAIAFVLYAFCLCIFPVFFEKAKEIGGMLPPGTLFFGNLFEGIRLHPFYYASACAACYLVSVRTISSSSNAVINFALLLAFGLILLIFCGPFIANPHY